MCYYGRREPDTVEQVLDTLDSLAKYMNNKGIQPHTEAGAAFITLATELLGVDEYEQV